MAIDRTNIALDIASRGVVLAGQLENTIESLNALLEWGLSAGLDLTNYDEEFAASSELKHVDGLTLNWLFGVIAPNIKQYMEQTFVSGSSYRAILQKSRRA